MLGAIRNKMINPLLPLLDLLARQASPSADDANDDDTQSLLLTAILPLPQRLLLWVQAQLAAIPQQSESSWAYPTTTSPLFSSPYTPPYYLYSDVHASCECVLCRDLLSFVKSATDLTVDFREKEKERTHIEGRIRTLRNPNLQYDTIRSGKPHTLRVVKCRTIAAVCEERRAVLGALIERLHTSIAAINDRLETSTSSSSSASSASASATSSTSQPPLEPVTSQSTTQKGRVARKKDNKRRREVIELDVDEQQDKENRQSEEAMQTTDEFD